MHPHGPLLVPRAGQAKRFVPCRQLHRAGACVFGQGHRQHFNQDAVDVVFRLLFGQAKAVHLHPVTEPPHFGVFYAITFGADLIPKVYEGAHFAHLCHEADARVYEERNPPHERWEIFGWDARLQFVQNGCGGCQSEGELLFWRRACFLQVVRTDVHRVPLGDVGVAIFGHIRDHLEARLGRAHICAARQIFLDQIILNRALQARHIRALFFGNRNIERQQPRRCRVDGHRCVHLFQRDLVKERSHIAQMRNRHADFAYFPARQNVVAVVPRLRWKIEGNGQSCLPLFEVRPIERI